MLGSSQLWRLVCLEISDWYEWDQGSPPSFHWLPAFPSPPCKAHLAVGHFMPWWSCLPVRDKVPEPRTPAQDLLMLDNREPEVSEDGCNQTLFPPLSSACPSSTVLGLSASLAPTTFPHISSPPSSNFFPYWFTLPSSQSQSTGLISWGYQPSTTLFTLPYHHAYRPLHHHHHLHKLSLPPNALQAEIKNPLGRGQWQLASLVCFHVTANVPCYLVVRPSSVHWLSDWVH